MDIEVLLFDKLSILQASLKVYIRSNFWKDARKSSSPGELWVEFRASHVYYPHTPPLNEKFDSENTRLRDFARW